MTAEMEKPDAVSLSIIMNRETIEDKLACDQLYSRELQIKTVSTITFLV